MAPSVTILNLPAEVLCMIFRLVFKGFETKIRRPKSQDPAKRSHLRVYLVCKAFHEHAEFAFFDCQTLVIKSGDMTSVKVPQLWSFPTQPNPLTGVQRIQCTLPVAREWNKWAVQGRPFPNLKSVTLFHNIARSTPKATSSFEIQELEVLRQYRTLCNTAQIRLRAFLSLSRQHWVGGRSMVESLRFLVCEDSTVRVLEYRLYQDLNFYGHARRTIQNSFGTDIGPESTGFTPTHYMKTVKLN